MHKITLGKYKGLSCEISNLPEEKELEKITINKVLSAVNNWLKVNQTIDRGDKVTIKCYASMNGTIVPEMTTEGITFAAGDPFMLDEFQQIIGKKQNDILQLQIHFTEENAPTSRLVGQNVQLEISIKNVIHADQPPIDEHLIQKIFPNFSSLEELKNTLKEETLNEFVEQIKSQYIQKLLDQIVQNSNFILDDELLESELHLLKQKNKSSFYAAQDFHHNIKEQLQQFEKECKSFIEKNIKEQLVLQEISKLEHITISEEEIAYNQELLIQSPEDQDYFNRSFSSTEDFKQFLLQEKTLAKLYEYNPPTL